MFGGAVAAGLNSGTFLSPFCPNRLQALQAVPVEVRAATEKTIEDFWDDARLQRDPSSALRQFEPDLKVLELARPFSGEAETPEAG